MKPRDFCAVPPEMFQHAFPSDHPMNEDPRLTLFQRMALPVLLWFFDLERNRASGRSYLYAHVVIELALRGQEVVLEDLSTKCQEHYRHQGRSDRHFADLVIDLTRKFYPRQVFEYNFQHNTLRFRGRRPE